ncbi:MAG: hypothetical protein KDA66_21280, partial [Planctomycetaceae bacterium]|nr:hypothetical protein [Planctomycetaceae bacterium]
GVDVSLAAFGKMDETAVLFSESNTRFVVEVELEQEAEFLSIVPHATKLGQVVESSQMNVKNMDGNDLISVSLSELKAAWQRPFM